MSSFGSLSLALSSLFAQRRGMDVVGQNIANANTDGYTRQRVSLAAMSGPTVPAIWSTSTASGGGVAVVDVARLRDSFLEVRAQDVRAQLEQVQSSRLTLSRIESVFAEPGDDGFQALLGDMWAGFDDVANRPGDLAARDQLLQRAHTVTDWLAQASATLGSQWSEARDQLAATAHEVNQIASSVAELNQAILRGSQAQVPVNDLRDRRDALVLRVAELVGATTSTDPDGVTDVYVGGTALVRGATWAPVEVAGPESLAGLGSGRAVHLRWSGSDTPVAGAGGRSAALLDALGSTIPRYSSALDAVAGSLADSLNAMHATGYDLDGAPGGQFLIGTTAATIRVAVTSARQVAASAMPGGARDGSVADAMAGLATSTSPSSPTVRYRQLVVDLGVQAQSAARRVATQSSVSQQLDDAREAQAGVSMDEEMTQLLAFQRAYEAAARLMTAVDEALDTIINRTGLIGR